MIRVLEQLTQGFQVKGPSTGKVYRQVITSYVDDCNQLITVPTELLKILVHTSQMEVGTSQHILTSPTHRHRILQYMTPSWFTNLISFLDEHDLNIQFDDQWAWKPNLQREGDEYKMDAILDKSPFFSVSELRSINRVRLFLQVYSRSCICDNQGISKLLTAKYCKAPNAFRVSKIEWPEMHPTAADWTVWRKALKYGDIEKTTIGHVGIHPSVHTGN
jgi:hypothetical protein